jgi:hypothetical protein
VLATAAVSLALLERGVAPEATARGIAWLIETQEEDGGWQMDAQGGGRSSRRATHLASLALNAFAHPSPDRADAPTWPNAAGQAMALEDVYALSLRETWHGLPQTRPIDHTMFQALDIYAKEKLPVGSIEKIVRAGGGIEIHGVYPQHFEQHAAGLGLTELAEVDFERKPKNKRFNWVRPKFFEARRGVQPILAAAVIPGRDYFFHYATIVRHYLHALTADTGTPISLARYPTAERRLASWTELDERFVRPGDRVLLGYVEAIAGLLDERGAGDRLDYQENDFYGSFRYRLRDGSILNLLGVKYSYWGSLSAALVEGLCQQGATEILYIAKLGTFSSPDHIYSRIFAPDSYYVLHHDVVIRKVPPPRNGVLERMPGLATGAHVSIPTVLEEDYKMRRAASEVGAQSIDNEISQMAEAIAVHNTVCGADVSFSALHMATDYIRDEHERTLSTRFDLGNDKTLGARANKRDMIRRIADEALFPYLDGRGPVEGSG